MSDFSNRLKQLRRANHMTQAELANKIGVSKSSVNMYERGEREPGFQVLEAIADTFNVDLNFLMGREKGESPIFINEAVSDSINQVVDNLNNTFKELGIGKPSSSNMTELNQLEDDIKEILNFINSRLDDPNCSMSEKIKLYDIFMQYFKPAVEKYGKVLEDIVRLHREQQKPPRKGK